MARRLSLNEYATVLAEIKERMRSAQYAALRAVNKELVVLYWDIARIIVERQANAEHGAAIVERLAADLQAEFPGIAGYSRRNIFQMREFFLAYRDLPKVQPLVAQIGWTHNVLEQLRVLVLCMSRHAFTSDLATLKSRTFRDPLNKLRRFVRLRSDEAEPVGILAQLSRIPRVLFAWVSSDDLLGSRNLANLDC